MDTIVVYRNLRYPCQLVKRVQVKGLQTNIKGSICVSMNLGIAFLVDEHNTIIEYLHLTSTIDVLLNDKDKHHDEEVKELCKEFAKYISEETLDEVTIE